MKVMAVEVVLGKTVLRVFSSMKEFNKTEGWLDEKWVYITTSKDMQVYGAYSAPWDEIGVYLAHSHEKDAYELLHSYYKENF